MRGTIFLIHWKATEAHSYAAELRSSGWEVEVESEDGEKAYRRIKANPPDAVVICLSWLASHGRDVARSLRDVKATSEVPIAFVDGGEETVRKTRSVVPDATFTVGSELVDVLERFSKPDTHYRGRI